jgi:hypothetical protein
MNQVLVKRELLDRGLGLIHEVLKVAALPEDLKLKLAEWRTDVLWETEKGDLE